MLRSIFKPAQRTEPKSQVQQDKTRSAGQEKRAVPPAVPSSLLESIQRTLYQSFVRGAHEMSNASLPRQQLAQLSASERQSKELDFFPQAVDMINCNLASHDDTNLSEVKGAQYEGLISQVQQGERSNASAFAQAAQGWVKEFINNPSAPPLIGTVFNTGGTLNAGAIDHSRRKTGAALGGPRKRET